MRNHLLLCAFLLICGGLNAQTQLLGSPTTLVKNRGAFMSDSLLYIPKRSKTPADSGAIRYQISDSAIYVWTGSQWIKAGAGGTVTSITAGTGLSGGTITSSGTIAADTTVLSTRLWRQKAVDSLQANINLKVNISDTATMLSPYIRDAGYGLTKSSQSLLVDTAAIATRARVQKGIDSLGAAKQNVLTNPVTGTGTTNYVAKFTGTSAVGNSQIFDNGTHVGIGNTSLNYKLDITGNLHSISSDTLNSALNIEGQPDIPDLKPAGGGYFALRDRNAAGYGNLQIGGYINSPYGIYLQVNQGSTTQPLLLNPLGGEILLNTFTDAGAYSLQNSGAFYNTGSAILAASSGNVGIGTSSPTRKFQVEASGGMVIFQQSSGSHNGVIELLHSNPNQSGTARHLGLNFLNTSGTSRGTFHFYPSDTTTIRNYFQWIINTLEVMRIENDGKTGIGATSNLAAMTIYNPTLNSTVLEVRGGGGSSQSRLALTYGSPTSTTQNALLFSNTSAVGLEASLNRYIYFSTGTSSVTERMRLTSAGELIVDASGTDAGDYKLQVVGNVYTTGSLTTGAPSGGSIKPWKIGEAATVSPTSPNRTIRVEIDGTVYYIHAKTTND